MTATCSPASCSACCCSSSERRACWSPARRPSPSANPVLRRIVVDDRTLFGARTREISFGEIGDISIGYQGEKSNFVQTYYLALKLVIGGEYPLFAPGRFYAGASSRATVEGWRRRLQEYMTT